MSEIIPEIETRYVGNRQGACDSDKGKRGEGGEGCFCVGGQ